MRACFGTALVIWRSMRIANSGACAARAKVFMTWPADLGLGSVR